MISLEDCIGLCDLTEEEILAIAESQHVPDIIATSLGQSLVDAEGGTDKIFGMIVEDIRVAQAKGDRKHVQELLHVLHHFIRNHPESAPSVHPWTSVM